MEQFTDYLVKNGLLIYTIILMVVVLLFLGLSIFDMIRKTKDYEKEEELKQKKANK